MDTHLHIYSTRYADQLRELSANFSRYLNEDYPDVKWAKDILPEHVQRYVYLNESKWSTQTMRFYKSFFSKFAAMANNIYHTDLDFSGVTFITRRTGKVREHPMVTDDFIKLMDASFSTRSKARLLPLLTATSGTRVEELISIKPEEIDLDNQYVQLNNCKNGRKRDVPIAPEYLFIWRHVKEQALEKGWETVCGGMSLRKYIQYFAAQKRQAGIAGRYPHEGNHSIRKMYARRRFSEEQLLGKEPKEAWEAVQSELGHGSSARGELFRTYIGQTLDSYSKSVNKNNGRPIVDLEDLKKQADYLLSFKEKFEEEK